MNLSMRVAQNCYLLLVVIIAQESVRASANHFIVTFAAYKANVSKSITLNDQLISERGVKRSIGRGSCSKSRRKQGHVGVSNELYPNAA
jgi:hypothetical protein